MTTLIGTAPNILISGAMHEAGIEPFRLFDFSPIGYAALAGQLKRSGDVAGAPRDRFGVVDGIAGDVVGDLLHGPRERERICVVFPVDRVAAVLEAPHVQSRKTVQPLEPARCGPTRASAAGRWRFSTTRALVGEGGREDPNRGKLLATRLTAVEDMTAAASLSCSGSTVLSL